MDTGERDEQFLNALREPPDEPLEADRETLRFVRSWHRYPPLRDALTYQGVNLGEMLETHLLHKVVPVMVRKFGGIGAP